LFTRPAARPSESERDRVKSFEKLADALRELSDRGTKWKWQSILAPERGAA
jgi:hypothetical protein